MKTIRMNPKNPSDKIIEETALSLKKGAVVAHPTETVYGLAANIYDQKSMQKIYDIKGRRTIKPLSIMVDTIDTIEEIIGELKPFERKFLEHFLPGPLTAVLKFRKSTDIPFFKGRKTIGIRIPDYAFCTELLKQTGFPITTTSANKSGMKSAEVAAEVATYFGNDIDLLVDGGRTEDGVSSTVVEFDGENVKILRKGAISSDKIEDYLRG
jgi:L-threonylcarbamoyladenylate synthase